MTKQRPQRVGEEIKKEVSSILLSDLKDPGLSNMVSLTDVEVSGDLRHAKIFVSIYGGREAQEDALKILDKAKGFIRTELGKRIRLRHVPELEFRLDRSLEYGAHIDRVLKDLGTSEVEKKDE